MSVRGMRERCALKMKFQKAETHFQERVAICEEATGTIHCCIGRS